LTRNSAFSYKQAINDLADKGRISYRGCANELRETLRETLDYLAPDNDVVAQPSFKLDKSMTKPTMKQKVRYILAARGMVRNASKAPEDAVELIEERIGGLARATYDKSSISSHTSSERGEVVRIKNYVNALLAELLEVQA